MNFYESLFNAAYSVIGLYINIRVIKLFLQNKRKKDKSELLVNLIVWITTWLINYNLRANILALLILFCELMALTCFFYEGDMWKKVLVVTVSVAFTLATKEIVFRLFYIIGIGIQKEIVIRLCAAIFALIIIFLVERCIYFDKSLQIPSSNYISLAFIIVGSIILTELLVRAELPNQFAMFGAATICLIDFGIFFLYERVMESYQEKMKTTVMEQQVHMYTNQLDIIRQSQQNLKSLRHDMHNHLLQVHEYLQNEKYDEAKDYLEQMESKLEISKEHVRTGNIEIDGILNYKLGIIEDSGCVPEVEVNVPEQKFMSNFDLTVLLGNLLDNAIEALRNDQSKFLSIKIKYVKSILYISVYNSFNGVISKGRNKLLSLKEDKDNHGIGLSNVKNIVNKYSGEMKVDSKDGIYKTDIILYIK